MDRIPEDRDARLAFLEEWAQRQQRRLEAEAIVRADNQRRLYAEQMPRVVAQARRRIGQMVSLREGEGAPIPVVITKPSDVPSDRAGVFADLMARLREYRWADPIVSECDEPKYIAPEAVDLARKHCPSAPWLLYMEDDVILGPDFGLLPGLLTEADELFPYTGAVSFFSLSFDEPGWSIHPMQQFGSLLCTAIRNTDYLVGFRSAGAHLDFPDRAVASFLAVEYDAFALWCPSLVQHADVTSTLWGQTPHRRISMSYEHAYG